MSATGGSINGGGSANNTPDNEYQILCDRSSTGVITRFLRRYTRDISGTVTTTDTALDGVTAYVVLGTIEKCSECCPTVIGSGCWNDGTNSGTYTAIRNADGSVTLVDGVSGATVNPNNVVACAESAIPSIERLIGAGSITVSAGARACTVVVISGSPTLKIGTGATITLVRGTLDWGTGNSEKFNADFVFTGVAGSDFIVTKVV